jgi:uncharacterized protein (TIGR03067 family)
MRSATLLAALAAALVAAEDDGAKKELKKFEGTWVMVSGEKEGKKVAPEHVKKSKITWKGPEVHVLTPHQSRAPIKGTCTVDPSKRPRHMDWVRSEGPHKGETMPAIYEFISEDSYRVCFAPPGKPRPREFATKPGSGHTLHVWKRVKD